MPSLLADTLNGLDHLRHPLTGQPTERVRALANALRTVGEAQGRPLPDHLAEAAARVSLGEGTTAPMDPKDPVWIRLQTFPQVEPQPLPDAGKGAWVQRTVGASGVGLALLFAVAAHRGWTSPLPLAQTKGLAVFLLGTLSGLLSLGLGLGGALLFSTAAQDARAGALDAHQREQVKRGWRAYDAYLATLDTATLERALAQGHLNFAQQVRDHLSRRAA
jgi:hypothetical protein